jgi:alkylresorcinol/alkylpyrone synthase
VLHSAGRRVIEQVGKLMELDESRLAHSRHVLQKYGNMSSATVVFVLNELMQAKEAVPGDWGLMIALGPGFAAEGALLRW